ncbi:MAG: DUF2628 domain-containing protein [Pseudomonadota bacterium]
MTSYLVMALPDDSRDGVDLAGAQFVKQGFSVMAAVLPLVWFLWNGMIVSLVLVAAVYTAFLAGISLLTSPLVIGPISLLVGIWFGFESSNLRRSILALRNYREIGIAEGDGRDDAAERFFLRWELDAKREREAGVGEMESAAVDAMPAGYGAPTMMSDEPTDRVSGSVPAVGTVRT